MLKLIRTGVISVGEESDSMQLMIKDIRLSIKKAVSSPAISFFFKNLFWKEHRL